MSSDDTCSGSSSSNIEHPLDCFQVGGKSPVPKSRKKKAVPDDVKPIDEIEQDKIVADLKQDAERLSSKGRAAFYYLFLTISGIFILCLTYSLAYPFEMEHQVRFKVVV
jgi:hypothetical protein